MKTAIIVLIIAAILALALRSTIKHFQGKSSCCGTDDMKPRKKKLSGPVTEEKIIHIEGMHCQHCKQSVESSINEIHGAKAKVDLDKNIAVVSLDRPISDEQLEHAVKRVNFTVTGIESQAV